MLISNTVKQGNKQLTISKLYNLLGYIMTCLLLGSIAAFLCGSIAYLIIKGVKQ